MTLVFPCWLDGVAFAPVHAGEHIGTRDFKTKRSTGSPNPRNGLTGLRLIVIDEPISNTATFKLKLAILHPGPIILHPGPIILQPDTIILHSGI